MNEYSTLIDILEKSIKKNGDKPITISHLINILKMAESIEEKREDLEMKTFDPNWD